VSSGKKPLTRAGNRLETLPQPVCMASILDVRLARQFMNSDAFFTFSAMRDLFRQVAIGVAAAGFQTAGPMLHRNRSSRAAQVRTGRAAAPLWCCLPAIPARFHTQTRV
jgi:hypothetical protein